MDSHKQDYDWQQAYNSGIQDTGVTTPDSYNIHASPQSPYVLTAAMIGDDGVPYTYNPAGMLYASGGQNTVLLSAANDRCDTGCVTSVRKPDPRVFQVKPLYAPSVFKSANDAPLPNPYNVVGMY